MYARKYHAKGKAAAAETAATDAIQEQLHLGCCAATNNEDAYEGATGAAHQLLECLH